VEAVVDQRHGLGVTGVRRRRIARRGGVEQGDRRAVADVQAEQGGRQPVLLDARLPHSTEVVGDAADGHAGDVLGPAVKHPRRERVDVHPGEGAIGEQRDGRQEAARRVPRDRDGTRQA